MALAILELDGFEGANLRFHIDTGTNRYYQLKIGRDVRRRYGLDWVDEVYFTTPMAINERGGALLSTSKDIVVPISRFDRGNAYVQLYSYKDRQGKSPAFSSVVRIPMGLGDPVSGAGIPDDFTLPFSVLTAMNTTATFQPQREIPCRTYKETYARQASLDDVLAGILKIAAPLVQNLMAGAQNSATAAAGSNGSADLGNLLTNLLTAILGNAPSTAPPATSQQQSLTRPAIAGNRFLDGREVHYAQPFFWQAILQAAAGELVKILPELMNSANQKRVQLKQADNQLMSNIISTVNQRLLLEQLQQAQHQPPAGVQAADISQLIQLLQKAPAEGAAPAPPAATAQSLVWNGGYTATLSSRAVLSFLTADPVPWNGTQKVLFARNQPVQFKVQLSVTEPAPKSPLPKAILKFTFKDNADQTVLFEKTFKQKNVPANSPLLFSFTTEDLAHLPPNRPISAFAEIRWLSPGSGREHKAMGSLEMVLVTHYFLREQGMQVSDERELTDMNRFRPFWNKIWEAPSLDAAGGKRDGEKKYLWELDVNAKYSVLLSAGHEANGLMQTKILRSQPDPESLSERTEGRMKAGIELSVAELNKLLPLWDGGAALGPDELGAFQTDEFSKQSAGEFIYHLKLKGRAADRGMIWVVPVFKLCEFTLGAIGGTDETGQVVEVGEEKVRFPLPAAARVIGLKSGEEDSLDNGDSSENGEPTYTFPGFQIEFSEKIALTPPAPEKVQVLA